MSGFPLGGPVAVAGSRHGSPWPVVPVVRAVIKAGGHVRTGCARGVDRAVRVAAGPAALVLVAADLYPDLPPGAALAARTRAVVAGSSALAVFPPAGGALGPGSALAVRSALERSLPVWVAGDLPPPDLAPFWEALSLAGVRGWLALPELRLF